MAETIAATPTIRSTSLAIALEALDNTFGDSEKRGEIASLAKLIIAGYGHNPAYDAVSGYSQHEIKDAVLVSTQQLSLRMQDSATELAMFIARVYGLQNALQTRKVGVASSHISADQALCLDVAV